MHSPTDFDPLLQKALLYVTAHWNDRTIGFVKIITDGGVHGFLLDTTVLPEFRRRGIGTELTARAIDAAKEHHLEWIHVDYEIHLEGFYAKCGFRPSAAGVLRL